MGPTSATPQAFFLPGRKVRVGLRQLEETPQETGGGLNEAVPKRIKRLRLALAYTNLSAATRNGGRAMTRQPTAFIYARVSISEQDPQMQLRELRQFCKRRGWRIVREYVDRGISGSEASSRPQLDQLMRDCRMRLADSVVVYRYDRFARSLRQLVNALGEFDALGVQFASLHEGVDTTTPNGRLIFGIFASIAEFERELICQRIRSGLALARSHGKQLGRKPVYMLRQEQIAQLKRERRKSHDSLRTLARRYGIPLWRVYALCSGKRTRV